MHKLQGVYIIRNIVNSKIYVGSSKDIEKRWLTHKWELLKHRHGNKHLQAAWDRYGESNFIFSFVEPVLSPTELSEREQSWLDSSQSYISDYGYNQARYADTPGSHPRQPFSDATIQKMRQAALGRKMSEEAKRKMSMHRKGISLSEETKRRIGLSHKGKHLSEEFKKRLSLMKTGLHHTEETKRKLSLLNVGKHHSEETKQKMSLAHLNLNY